MKTFGIKVEVDHPVKHVEALADVIYGRCADACVSATQGRVFVSFDREAQSQHDALLTIIVDLRYYKLKIKGITFDE